MSKCHVCGNEIKLKTYTCFNCGKKEKFNPAIMNMNVMEECCLTCMLNIIRKKRKRMLRQSQKTK